MKSKKRIDKEKELKRFLIPKLRRFSLYWTARTEAKNAARIDRGLYKCASCNNIFNGSQIQLDHRNPIVNVKEGWRGWDHYIHSLFCDASNYQVLCIACHTTKTLIEDEMRLANRKKKKKLDNNESK